MDAAATVDPNWVIDHARPAAEKILDEKRADPYEEAIKWLIIYREDGKNGKLIEKV
ncbi:MULTISPECIES: hypothetical protein [unclassified Microcystis]|uniref:hypothetical protein n=1 Tax=unclassified Microcystis TaxID=2643300 RepID=UPI002585B31E|nr:MULTISPECIES: hypothetical protein [unclassified Microcystis]